METTPEMTGHQIIPLFPLGVVLLPQMELPLHIFEERYKVMISECLEHDHEFGVVYSCPRRGLSLGEKVLRSEVGLSTLCTTGSPLFTAIKPCGPQVPYYVPLHSYYLSVMSCACPVKPEKCFTGELSAVFIRIST